MSEQILADLKKAGSDNMGNLIEMMKDQADRNNDPVLRDAANFIAKYSRKHSHFILRGDDFALNKVSIYLYTDIYNF